MWSSQDEFKYKNRMSKYQRDEVKEVKAEAVSFCRDENDDPGTLAEDGKLDSGQSGANYDDKIWKYEEDRRLAQGLELYGKDWKRVTEHVGTRNELETYRHAW